MDGYWLQFTLAQTERTGLDKLQDYGPLGVVLFVMFWMIYKGSGVIWQQFLLPIKDSVIAFLAKLEKNQEATLESNRQQATLLARIDTGVGKTNDKLDLQASTLEALQRKTQLRPKDVSEDAPDPGPPKKR